MGDYVKAFQDELNTLDKKFAGNGVLEQFEAKTKLPKSYGVLGAASLYLLLIFINVGGIGEILSNFIGFVIPTYYSLVALKTPGGADDTELLTYWVVFAFLNVIEFWSKAILYWVPFYWFMKTLLLVYLALPQTSGAKYVYNAVLEPVTSKYIKVPQAQAGGVSSKMEGLSTSGKTTGFASHSN
ncbi:Protein YOP1 [Lachancea thermotolerans]|uniref:Protein YOP1 n=1 Tax=Lachancea thermotolerans (strain ATCC 56472 / CBS 6340 / NRRL Y-8284) TaxID=559295 RepID=C5DE21_LACTC|nr:KLTH0C05632p [Lachancea thermotolerans CBS 6340]CAR22032.1 KLTH0C05632p [Lachancea thermotolerans CBS 6340]